MNIEIEETTSLKIGKCKHIVTIPRSQSGATILQQAGTLISVYVTNERVGCLNSLVLAVGGLE